MKFWYHVVAALVGLAISALIVWFVFGSASEEGATQEGSAGSLSAESLCGSITPAKSTSAESRLQARENPPTLYNEEGLIPAISDDKPDQQDWVDRVHAAGGLCIEELRIEQVAGTTVTLGALDDVSEAEAADFTAGVFAQAFTAPFNPRKVTVNTTVGDSERTAIVSQRAWNAYQIRREALGMQHSMRALVLFRQATSYGPADLRIVGWR